MRRFFRWTVLAAVLAIVSALLVSVAGAQAPDTAGTVLTFGEARPIAAGEAATVTVQLTTSSGQPVSGAGVDLYLDGARQRRALTDANGAALFEDPQGWPAGDHEVKAVFDGIPSRGLASSTASIVRRVSPAVLQVQTIPPLAGARFTVVPASASPDAQPVTFVSDGDGVARTGIDQAGTYRLEVLPWDAQPDVQAAFSRWADDFFTPGREVNVKSSVQLQVGFDVSYPVSLRLVDLGGQAVDWQHATSATLTSSTGVRETFSDSEPKWLPGGRAVRRSTGLEETKILYSVDTVTVRGSNVVNSKQQRFYPSESRDWQIQLSLYAARFTARDALFRFPIGSGIQLEYPDGHTEQVPFESSGETTVTSLPRGTYHVKVDGPGMSFSRPIVLSRDQEMQLEVISYYDMAAVSVLLTSIVLGLLFIGRPHLLFGRRGQPSQTGLGRPNAVREEEA